MNHACDNNVIKLSAVNPAHSYFVVGETPKGRIQFMIDTGAAVFLFIELYDAERPASKV